MPALIKYKLPSLLTSRTALNVYFWVFMLDVKSFSKPPSSLPLALYFPLLLLNALFFIVPCTVNNYLLVPRLLRRKKYVLYIGTVLLMVYVISFIYAFWLKYLLYIFPQLEVFEVSMVSPPLDATLTVESTLSQMRTIFNLLLLFVFAFTGAWYIRDHSRNERAAEEAMKKQLETELNFLKSQINPHFLFNTLNNLYGLALKNSSQTPEAILKLSSILRYILYESNSQLISFEKEKEIMQAYIDIEMLRLTENENAQFSIISDQPRLIPPLLWLPVLENVFKHGASSLDEDHSIDFRFAIRGNTLSIQSKNKFKPVSRKHDQARPGGIGLSNLRKRLEILYPTQHSISTGIDADNFYIVNVQITWHE